MTVDFRARLICSLGGVIDGSVSRNHINDGSGLQMVSGTITLEGLRVPPRGATVELAYEVPQDGTVTRFPHPLRVLKAQAQPQEHQTTVEVGCLLKLMADKVDPSAAFLAANGTAAHTWEVVRQSLLDDQFLYRSTDTGVLVDAAGKQFYDNPGRRPILAQEVLEHCLTQVAIKLDPSSVPLGFRFLRWKIDLSNGYVKTIGDLLRSECCFGYVNQSERLVVRKLPTRATMGTGVVVYRDKLADLQPITGGDQPAERYRVRYQSNELPLWIEQDGSRPTTQWMTGRVLAEVEPEAMVLALGLAVAAVTPIVIDPDDTPWQPPVPVYTPDPTPVPAWAHDPQPMGSAVALGVSLLGVEEDRDPLWTSVPYLLQFGSQSAGGQWSRDPLPSPVFSSLDEPPYTGNFTAFPVAGGNGGGATAKAWAYASRAAGQGPFGDDAAVFAVDHYNSERFVPQIEIENVSPIEAGVDFTAEGWASVASPGPLNSVVRLWSVLSNGDMSTNSSSVKTGRGSCYHDESHSLAWSQGAIYWRPGIGAWNAAGPPPYIYRVGLGYGFDPFAEDQAANRLAMVSGVPANQFFHWCVQRKNGLIYVAANGRWSEGFVRDERSLRISGNSCRHYLGSSIRSYDSADRGGQTWDALGPQSGMYVRPQNQFVGKAAGVRLTIGARYDTTRPFVRPTGPFPATGS